jgi:hypothetical protein
MYGPDAFCKLYAVTGNGLHAYIRIACGQINMREEPPLCIRTELDSTSYCFFCSSRPCSRLLSRS